MKKRYFTFLIFLTLIAPANASLDSLLTGIDKIQNIKLSDLSQEYVSTDLFVMIDGGAEAYIEYGFQKALDVKYLLDSTKLITVQIYEMTDNGAAFGIFTSTRNQGDQNMGIGDYSSGNEYYIMVQKGRYYYVVSAEDSDPEVHASVVHIAKYIADNISENGIYPEIVKKSLTAGFDIEHFKYIRGKIALSGNYFFAHKEIFKTRDAIYTELGESKVFIFQYPDNISTQNNLKLINEELVASGRYTQFQTETDKISCLDKNMKPLNLWVHNNYVIVTVGKQPDNNQLASLEKNF